MRALIWFLLAVCCGRVVGAQATAVVCVRDEQGKAIAGATLSRGSVGIAELSSVRVAANGCATVGVAGAGSARGLLSAEKTGFAQATIPEPAPGATATVVLHARTVEQSVTVTADRGMAGVNDQATSVAVLSSRQLAAAPALTLDDRLHQVAGFQLFRRTSSWTANPTTEGVSLRGLGSTAASRTLVVSDEVPLNDSFGGWIHWDEIPTLAIEDVQLERGGAADLYGSSAIGGVIAVDPVTAASASRIRVAADALGATEDSATGDLLVTAALRPVNVLFAGSGLETGGYIPTAPPDRGLVDTPANVAEESGRLELRSPARANDDTVFLRGNVLNEARGNGTPLQTNGTRLWRYVGGGDANTVLGHAALRVFGDRETYRQSFSAITPTRDTETLTRLQAVPTDEFGFALNGSRVFASSLTAGLGVDLRDVRATDAESPVSRGAVSSTTAISAHQREWGGYAEGIWQPKLWSISASIRVDSFRTFDGRQTATNTAAVVHEPEIDELVASPHLGVVRRLPHGFALTGTAFRAFRGPTMNELYRRGQVGQQITLANPSLLAERATGFELGAEVANLQAGGHSWGHLRASYFWTEVNRPVSAVLLSQTATAQTLQRQNLGQIRSRGLSLEGATERWRGLDGSFGYQLAIATVTAFNTSSPVQANLTGNWIPQVPRESVASTLNYARPRVANLHLIVSYTGRAFDDAANQFLLHPYARFDLSADRELGEGLSLYVGVQNLLDRTIDAGRTPLLTLAPPRLIEAGVRYRFSR